MSSFDSSVSKSLDLKHKIEAVVYAIKLYLETQSEEHLMPINTHLQHLSNAKDVSIFEPHTVEVRQLFNSIYELMNSPLCKNTLPWNCVNLLTCICRNAAAREVLINTYQFVPILSQLLDEQLPLDKKKNLLRLLQDLTCGIRIVWHMPHLNNLIITLHKWLDSPNSQIVSASFGILANVCYKNVSAVHTLMANVNVKTLLKSGLLSECPISTIHIFKLMLSVENFYGVTPKFYLTKLIHAVFTSISDAFRARDLIQLRHIVDFFSDVCEEHHLEQVPDDPFFAQQIKHLLETLENQNVMEHDGDSQDGDCIGYVLKFFNVLITNQFPAILKMYPIVLPHLSNAISNDAVAFEALNTTRSLIVTLSPDNEALLKALKSQIPTVIEKLNWTDHPVYHTVQNKSIAAALALLKTMLSIVPMRDVIVHNLRVETIEQLFGNWLYCENNRGGKVNEFDMNNMEILNVQAHAIALVIRLAKYEMMWASLLTKLEKNKQAHLILALCLQNGTKHLKQVVLEVCGANNSFPTSLAEALVTLQPVTPVERLHQLANSIPANSQTSNASQQCPMSAYQVSQIDEMLAKFRNTHNQSDMPTSDVMSLYEYKLASMANTERAAQAAADRASELCNQTQHRNAQLTTDIQQLHKALLALQKSNETILSMKENLCDQLEQMQEEVHKHKRTIAGYERKLAAKNQDLTAFRTDLDALRQKWSDLEQAHNKTVEEKATLEKIIETSEKQLNKLKKREVQKENTIKQLNETIESHTRRLGEMGTELEQKEAQLKATMSELVAKRQILDTITKYATQSREATLP